MSLATALLNFFSTPVGTAILAEADTELKSLFTSFLKAHIKAQTPTS